MLGIRLFLPGEVIQLWANCRLKQNCWCSWSQPRYSFQKGLSLRKIQIVPHMGTESFESFGKELVARLLCISGLKYQENLWNWGLEYTCARKKYSSLKLPAQHITRDTAAVRAAEAKSSNMRTQEETHGQVETWMNRRIIPWKTETHGWEETAIGRAHTGSAGYLSRPSPSAQETATGKHLHFAVGTCPAV